MNKNVAVLKMAHRRANRMLLLGHICSSFDLVVFKIILGSSGDDFHESDDVRNVTSAVCNAFFVQTFYKRFQ